jgi:hypothetical protein
MRKKKRNQEMAFYSPGADPNAVSSHIAVGAIVTSMFAVIAFLMALAFLFVPHGEYTSILSRPWRFDPIGFYVLLAAVIAAILCFGFVRVSRVAACVSLVGMFALAVFLVWKGAHPKAVGWVGVLFAGALIGTRGVFRLHKFREMQANNDPLRKCNNSKSLSRQNVIRRL